MYRYRNGRPDLKNSFFSWKTNEPYVYVNVYVYQDVRCIIDATRVVLKSHAVCERVEYVGSLHRFVEDQGIITTNVSRIKCFCFFGLVSYPRSVSHVVERFAFVVGFG